VVERLIKAAGNSRYALRDPPIVTGCGSASWYHCAGTASTFAIARFTLRRKGSSASVHPLTGREMRALRRLQCEQEPQSSFVFTSERGAPFAPGGFRTLLARTVCRIFLCPR